MKQGFLMVLATAAILYLTLSSHSNGAAFNFNGNKTGSPGSNGTCAGPGCHTLNTITSGGIPQMIDSNTGIVYQNSYSYKAGHTYTITFGMAHPTLQMFGFQLVALKPDTTQAGSFFVNHMTNYKTTQGGIEIVEQMAPQPGTGMPYSYVETIKWRAPITSVGPITMHGIVTAVNFDGTATGDETGAPFSITLVDSAVSVENIETGMDVYAYPNPFTSQFKVGIDNMHPGNPYSVKIYNLQGQLIQQEQLNNDRYIDAANLAPGCYFLNVSGNERQGTVSVIKQ